VTNDDSDHESGLLPNWFENIPVEFLDMQKRFMKNSAASLDE